VIEVWLLAAGLLGASAARFGHETIRLTDAGIAVLAETLARTAPGAICTSNWSRRVAREMTRAGRLAWRGLAVRARRRARLDDAMPDVFSIRHTTVEAACRADRPRGQVQRADLLVDLRRASKREGISRIGGECWYVLREGIASADEIPRCGVLVASDLRLEVVRPAPNGRRGSASRSGWRSRARRRSMAGA
jgi:hypothetical protein